MSTRQYTPLEYAMMGVNSVGCPERESMEDKQLEEYIDENSYEAKIRKEYESGKNSFWWNPRNIRSYNCLFNFIIGNRGGGKSFGVKEYIIKHCFREEREFVILRRTEVEMKDAMSKFMDDLIEEDKFPGYTWRVRSDEIQYIECNEDGEPMEDAKWQTMGHGAYLSSGRRKKSVPYPKVDYIIFDEFLIPNAGINSYLPDEVTCFLEFYETVARMRDVVVFFLANAMSQINPYFLYFDLQVPYGKSICRIRDDIAFEMVDNAEYRKKKKATRFGKIVSGTEYERYAIDNEFIWDYHDDITKLDKTFSYWCTLSFKGEYFGCFRSMEKQQIVISSKYDKTYSSLLEITLKNGKLNKMMISQLRRYYHLNALFDWFMKGFIYYDSTKVKGKMHEMFRYLM